MDNYLYFCTECNKLFKVADTGRKVKCSHCSKPLVDLEITDTGYAALDPDKREALKNRAREGEAAPAVEEPAVQTPGENTGKPETETRAPEPDAQAPEVETKIPDAVPADPGNVAKEPEKKPEGKPRSSGLFDINALLYGSSGVDPAPETPSASAPAADINAVQKAAPELKPSASVTDINALLKTTPEPKADAPVTDINALLKATPEPKADAPVTDINALLKAAPEPKASVPVTDINALLKATPEPEAPAPAPESDVNTDTNINTDSISAFFDIGDSFKDPYMSEDDSNKDDREQEDDDKTIGDSMIPDSEVVNRIAETGAQLTSEIEKQSDDIIAVRNNYLKIQIQNQLLAVDNFMSICKLSALQDDGVVDKDEEKLLKRLEKATTDYKKALNKLV